MRDKKNGSVLKGLVALVAGISILIGSSFAFRDYYQPEIKRIETKKEEDRYVTYIIRKYKKKIDCIVNNEKLELEHQGGGRYKGRKDKLIGSVITELKYDLADNKSAMDIKIEGTLFSPSKSYKYEGEIIKPQIEYEAISKRIEEMRFKILTAEPFRITERKEDKDIALFKGITGLWIFDLISGLGESEEYE